jgi:putative transcriptional regulator
MRKEKILSESTIQKLREGKGIAWDNIEMLCKLLECQPGDLFEYIPD